MTVAELIDLLEDLDPGAEVRLMCQPSWPFEYSVAGVCETDDFDGDDEESELEPDEREALRDERRDLMDRHPSTGVRPKPRCVWLLEGRQLSYGRKDAWAKAAR